MHLETTPQPDWTRTLCVGADLALWFPKPAPQRQGGSKAADYSHARAVCADCPALTACREWALSTPDPTGGHGMFGGLTPADRAEARTDLQESA